MDRFREPAQRLDDLRIIWETEINDRWYSEVVIPRVRAGSRW